MDHEGREKNAIDNEGAVQPEKDSGKVGEEGFKWLLDEYAGNVYVADMESYELLYLNRIGCETLGLPVKKILGRKCYEVIQHRDSPCPFCNNNCLSETGFYKWEYYNPVLGRTFLIKNRIISWEGHRARLELSHDDFSSEYRLQKRERDRDAIIRTIPGGFARVDARDMRTILWYSGGFLELIGYTKEQFEVELHSQANYVHPDDIGRASEIMENSRRTGENTVVEGRIITRDGTVKILTMTYSYVSAEDSWDGIESFYSVGIDMTKIREEQERQRIALEDAYQTARVANSAKTNFMSSMSHDIRTPMNAILGMTAIARANLNHSEKLDDCLNKIDISGKHLLNLINEVLDMSRIESGKINLTLVELNLPDLIRRIMEICRPLALEKNQQFQINTGHLQHENVIADGERLQQVLVNILSNAIKYTHDGGTIILEINELLSTGLDKRQYEFVCIDNGIGISSEFMPCIFEPFARAEDPRISKLQGTGLGMSISENIVHMMNGTINVESELGKGSKFIVSLPLCVCGREKIRGDGLKGTALPLADKTCGTEETAAELTDELGMQRRLDGKRVLLAEDNDINREIAIELLQMQGVIVESVENGKQAVEAFKKSEPGEYDAILMDIQMPVMNGYDAVIAIRALERSDARKIPIIALTANAFTVDAAKARSVGMNDHVAKPIDIEYLIKTLQRWIY